MRLKKEEFVPFAPDLPGEEVRIHHCKQGKDNDRLYITRKKDGSIVAYCFHCGLSGYARSMVPHRPHRRKKKVDEQREEGKFKLPHDYTRKIQEWSIPAKGWVRRYGIKDDELVANNVGYSKYLSGVVVPLTDEEGSLSGYQCRPVDRETRERNKSNEQPDKTGGSPKYTTSVRQDRKGRPDIFIARPPWNSFTHVGEHTPVHLVVTEDILSAIKVSRVPEVVGVAVLGSSIKENQALRIVKVGSPEKISVFFDNDNRIVCKNQQKGRKFLEPFAPCAVQVITSNKDPKEHTTPELEELLK